MIKIYYLKSDYDLEKEFKNKDYFLGVTQFINENIIENVINLIDITHVIKNIEKEQNYYIITVEFLSTEKGLILKNIFNMTNSMNSFILKERILNNKVVAFDILEIHKNELRRKKFKKILDKKKER